MKWWKRLKKRRVVGLCLVLVFLFCFLLRSKEYKTEYMVSGVAVQEHYDKKNKWYSFEFKVEDKEFFVSFASSYKHKRKLVKNIQTYQQKDTICIVPEGILSFYPLCIQEDEPISFHLVKDKDILPETYFKEIKSDAKTYQNLKIYHLNHHKYFIWNYKGFYVIDEKGEKEISLFSNDVYNVPLLFSVDKYLLLPDYESSYEFQKFYVINSKNNKVQELNLKKELPFDSYFLGEDHKKAYLVDKKNKIEYEINPKRLETKKVTSLNQGKILVDGEWESVSMVNLMSNEKKFTTSNPSSYLLEENTLYQVINNQKVRLSNQSVKEIVSSDASIVYYLVGDRLYYYSPEAGEVLVLSNFEWNFNYKNMIFVF